MSSSTTEEGKKSMRDTFLEDMTAKSPVLGPRIGRMATETYFQTPGQPESVVAATDAYYVSQMSLLQGTILKYSLDGIEEDFGFTTTLDNPRGLAINQAEDKLWAACNDVVAEITLLNGRFVSIVEYDMYMVAGMPAPNGLCLSPSEDTLYVTDPSENILAAIDLNSGTISVAFNAASTNGSTQTPNGCVVDEDNRKVWIVNQDSGISAYNIDTGIVGTTVAFSQPVVDAGSGNVLTAEVGGGIALWEGRLYASTWGPNSGTIWVCPLDGSCGDVCEEFASKVCADIQLDLKTPNQPQLLFPDLLKETVTTFQSVVASTQVRGLQVVTPAPTATYFPTITYFPSSTYYPTVDTPAPSPKPSTNTVAMPTTSPTVDDFDDSSDSNIEDAWCFSGNMEVVVQGKGALPMEALQVGDYVKIGKGEVYEKVYAFGHRVPHKNTEFVQIHTNAGSPLEVTSEHLVFVNGKTNPVRAGSIKTGDILQAEGEDAVVEKIKLVTKNGIYNPLTSSGTIQVNGITASNYVSFHKENNEYVEFQGGIEIPLSHHDFAHRAITPYRFYCTALAICDVDDAKSGMPVYLSMGLAFVAWSKKQNIAIQLLLWASFRMLLLVSILMACAVFMIPAYLISGKLMYHLQCMLSFESKSVVQFNNEMKKEN